jgi:hypothetical protein
VHDCRDVAAQAPGRLVGQAEAALLDVARHRGQAVMAGQPPGSICVVVGAHERVDIRVAASKKTRQHLSSHESRGAGEEHGAHMKSLSKEEPG